MKLVGRAAGPACTLVSKMNIFYLSHKLWRCARWHCDKHVVKMILETAQLLYTAHWVHASPGLPNFSTAPCRKGTDQRGYLSIRNKKHPSAKWARASRDHYVWLCGLGLALCREFSHRFGGVHSCEAHLRWLQANPPATLARKGWTDPPQAMPDEYRRPLAIDGYRAYYKLNKGEVRGMLAYSKRHRPHWL
jgi:hypothetical protein